MSFRFILVLLLFSSGTGAWAVGTMPSDSSSFILPMSCTELLPDTGPYLGFFEAVAKGQVASDRALSRRLFRILALRERIAEQPDRTREQNPIDTLIRRTLCFYREQKEPIKPVTFDDPAFLKFLRGGVKELEAKIDDAIFEYEFQRQQRLEYKRQLEKNRSVVDRVKREADDDADREFERLTNAARRKVRLQ